MQLVLAAIGLILILSGTDTLLKFKLLDKTLSTAIKEVINILYEHRLEYEKIDLNATFDRVMLCYMASLLLTVEPIMRLLFTPPETYNLLVDILIFAVFTALYLSAKIVLHVLNRLVQLELEKLKIQAIVEIAYGAYLTVLSTLL